MLSGYDGVPDLYPKLLELIQKKLESRPHPRVKPSTTTTTMSTPVINTMSSLNPTHTMKTLNPGNTQELRHSLSKEERVLNELNMQKTETEEGENTETQVIEQSTEK